jgi:hypothetical protein
MPKNYGYGVKPVKASMSKKYGRSKRKKAKKRTTVKTVMSAARSY